MNRKRIGLAIAAGIAIATLGGGLAFAVDGGTGHTGTPPHGTALPIDAQGYDHVCKNNFPPYEYMNGNLADKCFAGYTPVHLATDKAALGTGTQGPKGDTGPAGPKGDTGAPGKDGTDAQALPYGVALVQVSRNGGAATTWETLSTTLGSPVGDTTAGTFRFTCSGSTPCEVSVKAYTTADGYTVYPRLDIMSQVEGSGETYCEYADGADNDGASRDVGTTATAVPLGIGGTADCGAGQAGGVVDSILVPNGAQDHYDVSATFVFTKK